MERSFWSKVWSKVLHSLRVRLVFFLIGFIATYLEFVQAGWTLWFWVLCALTLIAGLSAAVPLIRDWLRERKGRAAIYYEHRRRVETLTELINDFATFEKARSLADTIQGKGNVRIVAILPVEGRIGALLNIGKEENLQVGTQLLVYRIDQYATDGQYIEEPLALVQVTYVQAGNNCSHAIVLDPNQEFWDQAMERLKREKKIEPPKNVVLPYIPPELNSLSLEDLTSFRRYLEIIHDSLTRIEPDEVVDEEGLQ